MWVEDTSSIVWVKLIVCVNWPHNNVYRGQEVTNTTEQNWWSLGLQGFCQSPTFESWERLSLWRWPLSSRPILSEPGAPGITDGWFMSFSLTLMSAEQTTRLAFSPYWNCLWRQQEPINQDKEVINLFFIFVFETCRKHPPSKFPPSDFQESKFAFLEVQESMERIKD